MKLKIVKPHTKIILNYLVSMDRGISYQAEIGKGVQLAKYVKLK